MSSEHLIAAAVLALIGFLWMFVNMKSPNSGIRWVSYTLMWAFFIAATLIAAMQVWAVLS